MPEVVILDAVRTAVGRRNGTLATMDANDVLGAVQLALFARTGVDPSTVDQVVGGCVQQVTMSRIPMEHTGGHYALVPMCCGGGLGTGTIIERLG